MMEVTFDLILFGLFLVVNLGVGLWYARDVRTVRDYAVGDKKFPTWIITLTIIATWLGGSSFNYAIEEPYKKGMLIILKMICQILSNQSMMIRSIRYRGSTTL